MTITPELIAELRRLCAESEAAASEAFDSEYVGDSGLNKTHCQISRAGFEAGWKAFAARNALPALLDEVERLQSSEQAKVAGLVQAGNELATLRAQVAERDAEIERLRKQLPYKRRSDILRDIALSNSKRLLEFISEFDTLVGAGETLQHTYESFDAIREHEEKNQFASRDPREPKP